MRKKYSAHSGFTLIELLVVFSIIAILASVTLASFVSYSRSQALKAATSEMATFFTQAKSRAQSQVKPDVCGSEQLQGYEVRICGLAGSTCTGEGKYALYVHCGPFPTEISSKNLPDTLSFSSDDTTSVSYLFRVLQQGVTGEGQVGVTDNDQTQILSVTQTGAISVQ